MTINLKPLRYGLFQLVYTWGEWGWGTKSLLQNVKTENDLSMTLFSQKHVSVVSIDCLFSCLVCVMPYDYDVISMVSPYKLRKLDIALVYQRSFGIVYIFAIYVFLVSHCYI